MISFLQLPSVRLFLLGLGAFFGLMFFIDREVGAALLTLSVLSAATVLVLGKLGVRQRELYLLFAFVLISHAAFAMLAHYTGFQPFGGGPGDYLRYDLAAQEIAERVRGGNFSLDGITFFHYFPIVIGYVYAAVTPAMIVGQLFVVWTAALAILVLYFITLELGASRPKAFFVALIGSLYPSFVFFTSYVLKESLVILFVLLSLLLLLKLLKRFSWTLYALMFLAAIPLVNLRSEIYDVFAITFVVFWFGFARMEFKRRMLLGVVLVLLYGLPSVIAMKGTQYGYYDSSNFVKELNLKKAASLKEGEYLAVAPQPESGEPEPIVRGARGSTVENLKVGADNPVSFLWNQARAFAFVTLGPFPWQFSESRHTATLAETVPWLLMLPFILRGIWVKFQEDKRSPALALVLFALGMFVMLALFINNFGITMRIRMPAILALLPFLAFAFWPGSLSLLRRLPGLNRIARTAWSWHPK